jgi:DNA-binding transcriptional LysR family regulator
VPAGLDRGAAGIEDRTILPGLMAPGMNVTLDLDLLRAFAAVAAAASFTEAGRRLNRTQSTISLQIKRLEDRAGRPLFERTPRTVRLTSDGELLLSYAEQILRLHDEVAARLREPDIRGQVRLGTPEDFATAHLASVLAAFARSHPGVALEVRCDLTLHLLDAFHRGEFDLVLVKREPIGPLDGIRVWREPLVWAAADTSLAAGERPLPLVLSPAPCVYRTRALGALDRARRPWRIAYTSPSLAGTLAAVRASLGVTVLPRDMVPDDIRTLSGTHGLPPLDDSEIALLRRTGDGPQVIDRLAEHIIRSLEGHAAAATAAAAD